MVGISGVPFEVWRCFALEFLEELSLDQWGIGPRFPGATHGRDQRVLGIGDSTKEVFAVEKRIDSGVKFGPGPDVWPVEEVWLPGCRFRHWKRSSRRLRFPGSGSAAHASRARGMPRSAAMRE